MDSVIQQSDGSKLAIVTCAASGIGEAVSALLVHRNFVVYGLDSSWEQEGIHKGVARLRVDFGDLSSTKNAIDELLKMYGRVDALINIANANLDVDDSVKSVIEQQFYNPVSIVGFVVDNMKLNKNGIIVNVSSLVPELEENKNSPFYSACKAALVAYAKSVKPSLLQHNVKICTVHPGPVKYRVTKNRNINEKSNSYMSIAKIILRAISSKAVLDLYTAGY